MDRLLERAGVASNAVAEARRMLIVHTIGAAAFATAPAMGDSEQPLTIAQIRPSFARSLTWLLTGIAYGARRLPRQVVALVAIPRSTNNRPYAPPIIGAWSVRKRRCYA